MPGHVFSVRWLGGTGRRTRGGPRSRGQYLG